MIAVTGATGTVGRELLNELADRGERARALLRHERPSTEVLSRADPVWVDFELPGTVEPALRGVTALFLLTPLHPRQAVLERTIIEAAARAGVRTVVKLSALGTDSPKSSIQTGHQEAERALARSGMSVTVLRPNAFMQNVKQWFPTIARHGAIMLPVGASRVSWIDARDIASVAAEVLLGGRGRDAVHELTGPQALSYPQLSGYLSEMSGRAIGFTEVSEEEAARAMQAAGAPEWAVRARLELYATYREGDAEPVSPAVADLLGRQPRTFADYARELAPELGRLLRSE